MVIIRELEARAIYRISSPSRVAMEQDSLSISLRCRSTGCAERASGVEASQAWPRQDPRSQLEIFTIFGIDEPQLAQGIQAAAHRRAGMPVFWLICEIDSRGAAA
jgi:hypothetical protein